MDLPPITKVPGPIFFCRTVSITAGKQALRVLFASGTRRPSSEYKKLNVTTFIPRAASSVANRVMKPLV